MLSLICFSGAVFCLLVGIVVWSSCAINDTPFLDF